MFTLAHMKEPSRIERMAPVPKFQVMAQLLGF
jgi:hypothetical protein